MNYQDYDTIQDFVERKIQVEDCRCLREIVTSIWNILKIVNCNNYDVFETVINGAVNCYWAGQDEIKYEEKMYWAD